MRPVIVSIGETLWDLLPSGEFVGGAPFNVAAHMARLGAHALLVTRIGNDRRGARALAAASKLGIDTELMQIDETCPTGVAEAELDETGSARYTFSSPAAWESIKAPARALDVVARADAIIYGVLSQRREQSRPALRSLIQTARWRVFDPNLRPPLMDDDVLLWGLKQAHFVKLNETESTVIGEIFGSGSDPEQLRAALMSHGVTSSLCITFGAQGSLLYHGGYWYERHAHPVTVVDTIGAGDSFLAALVLGLLRGVPPSVALERASRLGAFVASHAGAVPKYEAQGFVSPPE